MYIREALPLAAVCRARGVVASGVARFWSCVDLASLADVCVAAERAGEAAAGESAEVKWPALLPSGAYTVDCPLLLTGLQPVTHHPGMLQCEWFPAPCLWLLPRALSPLCFPLLARLPLIVLRACHNAYCPHPHSYHPPPPPPPPLAVVEGPAIRRVRAAVLGGGGGPSPVAAAAAAGVEAARAGEAAAGEGPATLERKWVRVKGPGQATEVHSDFPRFASMLAAASPVDSPAYPAAMVTCWAALGPCPLEAGPLVVLQGSHRLHPSRACSQGPGCPVVVAAPAATAAPPLQAAPAVASGPAAPARPAAPAGPAAAGSASPAREGAPFCGGWCGSSDVSKTEAHTRADAAATGGADGENKGADEGKGMGATDDLPPSFGAFAATGTWRTGAVGPGDVVVFDIRLVHASLRNERATGEFRMSVDTRWTPHGARA